MWNLLSRGRMFPHVNSPWDNWIIEKHKSIGEWWSVCMFYNLDDVQLQIQSVTWCFQKQKWISMSPECHMPSSTFHFKLQCVNWCVVFFFTSHTTCQNLNRVTCIWFLCKFLRVTYQKLAKKLSKIHIGGDDQMLDLAMRAPTHSISNIVEGFGWRGVVEIPVHPLGRKLSGPSSFDSWILNTP